MFRPQFPGELNRSFIEFLFTSQSKWILVREIVKIAMEMGESLY